VDDYLKVYHLTEMVLFVVCRCLTLPDRFCIEVCRLMKPKNRGEKMNPDPCLGDDSYPGMGGGITL
jgi:hypothetical protein